MEYGTFDILWKGTIQALIDEFYRTPMLTDDSKVNENSEKMMSDFEEQLSQFLDTISDNEDSFSIPTSLQAKDEDESPIKAKRKKRSKVIDSESEEYDTPLKRSTKLKKTAVCESDSDLEVIAEDWRLPQHISNISYLPSDSSSEQMLSHQSQGISYSEKTTHDNKAEDHIFQRPSLPYKPAFSNCQKRAGLRPRALISAVHTAEKYKKIPYSTSSGSIQSKSSRLSSFEGRSRPLTLLRHTNVPISIEEELIGEVDLSACDDEDFEEDEFSSLIASQAQCSDEGSDDESDGEYEQSFIHDGTILSQQLSPDAMHGFYLRSLHNF